MKWFRKRIERARRPDQYIFIVTYGRSGSTLLMNILNTADGCVIRGENNNALYHLYRSYRSIVEAQEAHGRWSGKQTSAWWGIADVDLQRYRDQLVGIFVERVLRPEPQHKVAGFKEIRFSQDDVPDLADFIDFLLDAFSNAQIIINHRKLDDVAKSKWWKNDPGARQRLEAIDMRLRSLDNQCLFHFFYDKALSDFSHIEEMFDWLGLPFSDVKVKEALGTRHSY